MGNFSGKLNPGNVAALGEGIPKGIETEQAINSKAMQNQAYNTGVVQPSARENQADIAYTNEVAQRSGAQPLQQTGGVFDPVRARIGSMLQGAAAKYQSVFGRGQQGQTNPSAVAPVGHNPGPAAQQTTQAPGNAAMSRPQPGTSNAAAPGVQGATGPMPLPDRDQVTGRDYPGAYAEGGAIPGRKLAGIRPKKAKAGNVAKATAGDKQVANQQPGAGGPPMPQQNMPPRNTEPGAGISNQDPQLADGGIPDTTGTTGGATAVQGGVGAGEAAAIARDADGGMPAGDGNFIQKAIKKPGQLHKDLGVPEGEKIPKANIKAAEKGGGKVAQRARFADTLSKFKDGGMPKLPKLEPGAAPEPKPAPNAVSQEVGQDGMRHYLGKTIKRFADGDEVGPPNPKTDVPTPAGVKDSDWPGLVPAAVGAAKDFYHGNVEPVVGAVGQQMNDVGNAANRFIWGPDQQTPGKGQSPPQDSNASAAALQPIRTTASKLMSQDQADAVEQSGGLGPDGQRIHGDWKVDPNILSGGASPAVPPRVAGAPQQGPETPQQGPETPVGHAAQAPIDFSQVQVDHSQIPSTSADDWKKLEAATAMHYAAHGVGDAMRKANADVTGMQHDNFMDYMRQGAALDAAGNKQGALAAYKTAYNYFPTGHDMHLGVGPDGTIIAFGVNEKTGEPVQNGAIKLDQQTVHGIMTHFANPENFVSEGLRMQTLANETNVANKATIPLARARTGYLEGANATHLAGYELRAQAAQARFASPDHEARFQAEFKDMPNHGEALAAAAHLEQLYQQHYGRAPDEIARQQIAGEVRSKMDPSVDPQERADWEHQRGINMSQGPAPSPVANRNDQYPMAAGMAAYGN